MYSYDISSVLIRPVTDVIGRTYSSNSGKFPRMKAMTRREAMNMINRMAKFTLVLPGPEPGREAVWWCSAGLEAMVTKMQP